MPESNGGFIMVKSGASAKGAVTRARKIHASVMSGSTK